MERTFPLALEASYFAVGICCAPRLGPKLAADEDPDPTNIYVQK